MIRYKKDIESRPKREWFMGQGKRSTIAKDSKEDLKNIKKKFETYNGGVTSQRDHQKKKRDRKRESKRDDSKKPGGGKDSGRKGKSQDKAPKEEHKFFKKKKHLGKRK